MDSNIPEYIDRFITYKTFKHLSLCIYISLALSKYCRIYGQYIIIQNSVPPIEKDPIRIIYLLFYIIIIFFSFL